MTDSRPWLATVFRARGEPFASRAGDNELVRNPRGIGMRNLLVGIVRRWAGLEGNRGKTLGGRAWRLDLERFVASRAHCATIFLPFADSCALTAWRAGIAFVCILLVSRRLMRPRVAGAASASGSTHVWLMRRSHGRGSRRARVRPSGGRVALAGTAHDRGVRHLFICATRHDRRLAHARVIVFMSIFRSFYRIMRVLPLA